MARFMGSLTLLLCSSSLLCSGQSFADQSVATKTATRTTHYSYRCDGNDESIVVTINGETGHLFSSLASQAIQRQQGSTDFAGEDVLYQPDSPPDLAPGQTATITIKGQKLKNCRNNPRVAVWEAAKLRGVSYRAIGQEPAWQLEIYTGEKFVLVTDYGKCKTSLPWTEPLIDQEQRSTRYRTQEEGGSVEITITGVNCSDSMSGEKFASKVDVRLGDNTLKGCGRALH